MRELSGFIVDVAIQLTLVFWHPSANEEYVLYLLSGLWGMSDGIWETQINGLFKHTHSFNCCFPSYSFLLLVVKTVMPL